MASSSLYEDEILDMLSTDSPLLTPPPATPAPDSDNNTTQITTTERQLLLVSSSAVRLKTRTSPYPKVRLFSAATKIIYLLLW